MELIVVIVSAQPAGTQIRLQIHITTTTGDAHDAEVLLTPSQTVNQLNTAIAQAARQALRDRPYDPLTVAANAPVTLFGGAVKV
jgi:hypothetical protein